MRRFQILLLILVLTGGFFSSGCTLMRPAINAAGDAAVDWWQQGGKEKVEAAAKDAAKSAADGALQAAKEFAAHKVDDSIAKLQTVGMNPDNLTTPAGILAEFKVGLKAIEDNQKKPPDQQNKNLPDRTELYIAIATIVLGGHFGKGVYRRVTQGNQALKPSAHPPSG